MLREETLELVQVRDRSRSPRLGWACGERHRVGKKDEVLKSQISVLTLGQEGK